MACRFRARGRRNSAFAKYLSRTCEYQLSSPSHGNLAHWADQGVLLLNSVLSVEGMAAFMKVKAGSNLRIVSCRSSMINVKTSSSYFGVLMLKKRCKD